MDDHALAGVTVPLITPLDESGRPDGDGARAQLEALAQSGVDSLLLLGSNGEGALLPPDLTSRFLVAVSSLWRELRPGGKVLINVSAPGTTDALRRAEAALSASPDALLLTPPGYFAHRPDEIEDHLRAIEQFSYPWAIYNVPKYACPLPVDVLRGLLDARHLIGMKDSSGDLGLVNSFLGVIAGRPDLALSQGDERNLVGGLQAGARGIVPGLANIVPALVVSLFRDAVSGRIAEAEGAQQVVTALTAVHGIRPGVPTVKAVLRDRGLLRNARCAPPLREVNADEDAALRAFLEPYEPWLIGGSSDSPTPNSHQERSA